MAITQCLVLLALVLGTAAHGGHFHQWPATPKGANYIRTEIASCSNWVPAQGAVKYSLVDAAANVTSKPVVRGNVIVWHYLYNNCSLTNETVPTAGVEFNATVTRDGKPLGGVTLDGVAMTGSCSAGGGSPYYFDLAADPIDDDENLLWFHDFTLPANGSMQGNGANDGLVFTTGPKAVRSVMLLDSSTREALACCDLTLAGPADTDWAATLQGKGKFCEPTDDDHAAAATKGNVTADEHDHDSHAGHDHGLMGNATTSAAMTAPRSTSSAPAMAVTFYSVVTAAAVAVLAL